MPKLSPYKKELPYGYAPGLYPAHVLMDARPDIARRLLVHSTAAESEGLSRLMARAGTLGIRTEVADAALRRISHKENCYAAVVFEKYQSDLSPDRPHIVLHHPADMGNLGTILRSCLGFGLMDIALIEPCADIFDPRVVRASMGALFYHRVRLYPSFPAYQTDHPGHTPYPFMLGGAVPLPRAARERPPLYALVFGNEAAGLPAAFAQVGTPVRIPHGPAIDSLNLGVAVSIAAYAFTQSDFSS